jgi:hypothetical protein
MPDRVVHFLVHVPRCAGTSLGEHFRAHLGDGFLIAPRWHNPLRLFLGERFAMRAGDPRLAGLKVVTGHSLGVSLKRHLAGAEIRESVLLREPVSYLVSLYNHRWAQHRAGAGPRPPAFVAWLRAQRRNPVSRFLLSHYFERRLPRLHALSSHDRLAFLEARLARFWFVADVSQADALLAAISRELGLPERAGRRNVTAAPVLKQADLDPALIARIRAANALDLVLWQRWRDRGWRAAGHDPGPPPPLAGDDRLSYLAGDALTTLRRLRVR